MILGLLADQVLYEKLHPGFQTAFRFLRGEDLLQLKDGRYPIDGEQIFAIVARAEGRSKKDSPLEYHQRYIDIQYIVEGVDIIGWQPTSECREVAQQYVAEQDIGFFRDIPRTWCHLPAGAFAIFFPEDAHAPLAGTGAIHKIVLKIAVN
jgi:YhcH/YjgK/YiaL family protein